MTTASERFASFGLPGSRLHIRHRSPHGTAAAGPQPLPSGPPAAAPAAPARAAHGRRRPQTASSPSSQAPQRLELPSPPSTPARRAIRDASRPDGPSRELPGDPPLGKPPHRAISPPTAARRIAVRQRLCPRMNKMRETHFVPGIRTKAAAVWAAQNVSRINRERDARGPACSAARRARCARRACAHARGARVRPGRLAQ
jgi:hypothetical protein